MNITGIELKEKLEHNNINLIDIRDPYQYDAGTIKDAKNISMNALITNPEQFLNKNEVYYIFCNYGSSSRMICEYLRRKGFLVVNLIGGYQAYKDSE